MANEVSGLIHEQVGGAWPPRKAAQVTGCLRLEQQQSLDDRPQSGASVLARVRLLAAVDAPDSRFGAGDQRAVARRDSEVCRVMGCGRACDSRSGVLERILVVRFAAV